jgi:DNA-binding transcriptional regulator GbsR (MarR family)
MDSLNLRQQSYVEDMGLFFEQYGSQRTMGKVVGLLLIAEQPLSQEGLMRLLNLSRTSASVTVRWAAQLGLVEQVSLSGDRKRYYQIRVDMAHWLVRASLQKLEEFLRLLSAAEGLADPNARGRLALMCELMSFLNKRMEAAFTEWNARQSEQERVVEYVPVALDDTDGAP